MKTFDQCLEEAENKYSRKADGKNNTDALYPILRLIVKEGTKTWLQQYRKEVKKEFLLEYLLTPVDAIKADFINKLLADIEHE